MSIALKRDNFLIVISSPSGGGKTTLTRMLLDSDSRLAYSVSTTTRAKREGEIEDVSYNFVTVPEFQRLRARGVFLESATVHDNLYGTRRDLVERLLAGGRDVILDIDVQGALDVRRASNRAVLVFILPPSLDTLEQRLRGRASNKKQDLERRLDNARREIEEAAKFDYWVINDDLNAALESLRAIIAAERLRAAHQRIQCRGEGALDRAYPSE